MTTAEQFRREFLDAASGPRIGGATVLLKLSEMASACIDGRSDGQDAVAFALSAIFAQYADEWSDGPVTGDDTYLLMGSGEEVLREAVDFVADDGNTNSAVRIIAALARLTPDRLYRSRVP